MAVGTDVTQQGASQSNWARSYHTTLQNNLKGAPNFANRRYATLTLIEKNGGIETNVNGRGWKRAVQYRHRDVTTNTGTTPASFAPTNLYKSVEIECRGYHVTDSIREKERLENRGKSALVNIVDTMDKSMKNDLYQTAAQEIYVDGEGSNNTERWHGFNSFTGVATASTVYQSLNLAASAQADADRNVDVADPIMQPDDRYMSLSTALGNYGGSQLSGIWPTGSADSSFDFYSPLLINTNSTYFGSIGSGHTGWQDNAVEAIAFGLQFANRNLRTNRIDLITMPPELLYQLKNLLRAKERWAVTGNSGRLASFGFSGQVEIDGVQCIDEYGVLPTTTVRVGPTTTNNLPSAYGWCTKAVNILSMYGGLWHAEDPVYDVDNQCTKFVVRNLSNLWFDGSPRSFIKWAGYSATS